MDTRKNVVHNFDPQASHDDAVNIEGLEDLFNWASEVVADSNDPRTRRTKEHKIRRNVLEMIQYTKEMEARDKYAEEINFLQRRVIALLQVIAEKMDENGQLRQIILNHYFAFARVAELESEVKQLQQMTWYREEAEAERKHLMDALSKLKKERDYLDELLTVTENENIRLAKMYTSMRDQLEAIRTRRWWHPLVALFRNLSNCATTP